ncbi:MAG TPA: alcohol dehydrogenase catalytic domain-containing protein [Ktedonobacterales bacterium]|nr:alcohol dehydrogenase catalytic domain-containing protein [Ktedonobacterales bacterium]
MRAQGYRIHAWGGPMRWEKWEVESPGPGEVLVRVEACGIGLTVLNCMRGDLSNTAPLPRAPGHELVGRVEALGPGVVPGLLGRRVLGYFYLSCGVCEPCLAGRDAQCANLAGWLGVHRDGGYGSYTVIPAANALLIPEEIEPALATAIPDAIATPLHVCKTRLGLSPLDRVAVIGAGGGVGIHMVQMARLFGAAVCGLDIAEEKFPAIREAGGEPALSRDWEAVRLPADWHGQPATAVIDLIGTPESLSWSLGALGMGGSLALLTTFRDRSVPLEPRAMVFRELRIVGSRYASKAEVLEAARLVAEGRIRPVVSQVVAPEDIERVHEALHANILLGRGAVLWPEQPEEGPAAR